MEKSLFIDRLLSEAFNLAVQEEGPVHLVLDPGSIPQLKVGDKTQNVPETPVMDSTGTMFTMKSITPDFYQRRLKEGEDGVLRFAFIYDEKATVAIDIKKQAEELSLDLEVLPDLGVLLDKA